MLDKVISFFHSLRSRSSSEEFQDDDKRVSVAGLCFQVMEADGVVHEEEEQKLRSLLQEHFSIDPSRIEALMQAGHSAGKEAVDYYRFTSDINKQLNEDERIELVRLLWDVAYADGVRSELEDHIIWRIADLLGVSDRDRIIQRQITERTL